jgi:glutathione-regulated potassium-efflux system protein KefB
VARRDSTPSRTLAPIGPISMVMAASAMASAFVLLPVGQELGLVDGPSGRLAIALAAITMLIGPVDHRDAEPLGQQHLVEDVAEAAEADHQDAGLGITRLDVLRSSGAGKAEVVCICIDDPEATLKIVDAPCRSP